MSETPDPIAAARGRASAAKHAWSRGALPDALAVLENDPELLADKSAAVDLAYEEFCRRAEAGEPPDPEEFVARFPAYQTSLRNVLLAHALLMENAPVLEETAPRWPEAGARVGDLTLLRELGRGAFARVFLATEASTGERLVAVKFSPGGAAEARMLGPLEHPNIVPVLSVHRDEALGLTAVRMPYRGSATLEDVLGRAFPAGPAAPPGRAALLLEAARSSLPPGFVVEPADPVLARGGYVEGVLHLGAQVADALAFLHERGVCHRDLKPSNVLLSPGGRPLLLDFNLSADAVSPHLGGTLPYMAPEQLEAFLGRGAGAPRPDGRADLFSLGVILYELLTGRHPFGPVPLNLSSAELARFLLEGHRRGCQPLRLSGDRRLARLVEGCLALSPAARPVSARAVAAALRRQLGWLARLRRWALRRPAAAACLAAGLALTGGGAGWAGTALYLQVRPSAQKEYQRGLAAYRAGDLVAAEDCFSQAAQVDRRQAPEHLVALGVARMKRAAAMERSEKAAADSKFEWAAGDFEAALGRLPSASGKGPASRVNEGEVSACLAYCRARLAHWGAAIAAGEQALGQGARSVEVLNNLAVCFARQGRMEKAAPLLGEALERSPDLTAALYNRAALACQVRAAQGVKDPAGQPLPAQALKDIERLLVTKPAGAHPYQCAAWLYALASQDVRDAATKARYQDLAVENLQAALDRAYSGAFAKDRVFRTVLARHPKYVALLERGLVPGNAPPAGTLSAFELVEPPVESLLTP
jgi:tetratricopeptide (TPR) repeat protein